MEPCGEMHLLVQADVDGELDAAGASRVVAHMEVCAACAGLHAALIGLSARVRADAPRFAAPAGLRAAVLAETRAPAETRARARVGWRGAVVGAGFALAASVALLLVPAGQGDLAGLVVAGHIRALQPGHLMDVPSTDQHTVKPWFDGRLDFAPPVPDLAPAGFALVGGRLDYLDGRAVAGLVYQRRQHVVDVFVWPDAGADGATEEGSRQGYNFARRRVGGMMVWVVSDLEMGELRGFLGLWR